MRTVCINVGNMFNVSDKIVIVTGAGRGNGLAIVKGFLNSGCDVIGVDIKFDYFNAWRYTQIESDIKDFHIDRPIDVLVNNAGVTFKNLEDSYSIDVLQQILDINLVPAYRLSKEAINFAIKENRPLSIINITSINADLAGENNPSYQASKAALKQYTKCLAKDFGRYNIRVNNICPGYIKTEMTKGSYTDIEKNKQRVDRIMLGRWGEPDDLAGPCVFLASDASRYITGSTIYVDGGFCVNGI